MKLTIRRKKIREQAGYGLVAVMMISVIGMMFLYSLAVMGLNLAVSERVGALKARSHRSAELAFNYVMKQFTRGDENPYLPLNEADVFQADLPADVVPGSDIKVKVRRFNKDEVAKIGTQDTQGLLYRAEWDPNGASDDWVVKPTESYFFMIQITAVTGGLASSLQATISPADMIPSRTPETRPPGVVANGTINLGTGEGYLDVLAPGEGFSSAQTQSLGTYAAFKTALQSNSNISVSPYTTVYGDLLVSNATTAISPVAQADNGNVFGRLQTNGSDGTNTQGFLWTNNESLPGPTDNVLALADVWQNDFQDFQRFGPNYTQAGGPVSDPVSSTTVNPTPMPTDAQTLPDFPKAELNPDVSNDVMLPAGSYSTPSLDSTGAKARIVVNSDLVSPADAGPTKLYIDNNSSISVKLDSSWLSNEGSASDMQIYYAGDKDIQINLDGDLGADTAKEFKATIYAPRAKVTTTGTGEFYGAILAKSVEIKHIGDFRVDPAAANVISSLTSQRTSTTSGGNEGNRTAIPKNYRVNTWQQVAGRLVQ